MISLKISMSHILVLFTSSLPQLCLDDQKMLPYPYDNRSLDNV